MQDYRLTQIAKNSLCDPDAAATVGAIFDKLNTMEEAYKIRTSYLEKFISTLFAMQPVAALDALYAGDEITSETGCLLIRDISLNHANPLDRVPDDTLIGWCEVAPQRRYLLMSRVISYSCSLNNEDEEWTSQAVRMLERSPDATAVFTNFAERFSPIMWEGSRAAILERRAKLLKRLDSRFGPALNALALAKFHEMQSDIDRQREWEMKHNRDRDESFE
jgi:hypothetical protein